MGGDPDERPTPGGGIDDFDAIVAGWRREGPVPSWPDQEPDDVAAPPAGAAGAAVRPPSGPPPEEEHFVPPEPPPLPRLAPPAAVGLVLLVLGIVLVASPGWVGVSQAYGMPLGLLTLAAGLGWLVLRLWPAPPRPGEDDDGAVL